MPGRGATRLNRFETGAVENMILLGGKKLEDLVQTDSLQVLVLNEFKSWLLRHTRRGLEQSFTWLIMVIILLIRSPSWEFHVNIHNTWTQFENKWRAISSLFGILTHIIFTFETKKEHDCLVIIPWPIVLVSLGRPWIGWLFGRVVCCWLCWSCITLFKRKWLNSHENWVRSSQWDAYSAAPFTSV